MRMRSKCQNYTFYDQFHVAGGKVHIPIILLLSTNCLFCMHIPGAAFTIKVCGLILMFLIPSSRVNDVKKFADTISSTCLTCLCCTTSLFDVISLDRSKNMTRGMYDFTVELEEGCNDPRDFKCDETRMYLDPNVSRQLGNSTKGK